MSDLVEFLAARYDEKERTAKAAHGEEWSVEPYQPSEPAAVPAASWLVTGPEGEDGVAAVNGSYRADHMALNDPAAVLVDIAMKRRILELHSGREFEAVDADGDDRDGVVCDECWEPTPCPTARLLGSEFAGHPDYQERWKV